MIDKRSNRTEWDLVPHQQDGFVGLMSTALNAYMNLLRIPFIPFSFYHMETNGTKVATQQAKQLARQATYQATEAATEQVRQLTEYATLEATAAATQQVKQLAERAALAEQAALQVAEAAGTAVQLQREQAQLWTFEHQLQEAESHRPVRLRVKGPGIAHAGINQEGKWIRTYDVPLEEVSPGVWEAYLLDPEINELTFIWYDPDQPGKVQWEGKNYPLPRQ
jgi:hypothetical protein